MPAYKPCPQCGTRLAIPAPPPEGVRCPGCQSVLSLRGAARTTLAKPGQEAEREAATRRPPVRANVRPPEVPRKGGNSIWAIGAGVAAVLLIGLVIGLGWMLDEGKEKDGKTAETTKEQEEKPKPKAEGPQILIDEDFEQTYKDKQSIPKGWSDGEAFVAVKEKDVHALKLTKPTGYHFVQLLPVLLAGDFTIECGYHLTGGVQKFTLRLEDRGKLALLPIVVDYTGKVLIADDARAAPPGFDSRKPVRMLVKREGKKLSILLNGDLVGSKNLDTAAAFDTIKLGLGEGSDYSGNFPRILGIRVTSLAP